MARTVLVLNNPKFKLADTSAGLSTGVAYECQLTSAAITPQPAFNTIPATGCAPATQSPGKTGWQLDMAWLQDWTASLGGLSGYAFTNDTAAKWFELTVDTVGAPTVKATGQCYVVSGAYGGAFGDGSAAPATATWPLLDKPVIVLPATFSVEGMEADTGVSDEQSA
jgi:hypothetical protein